MMTTLYCPANAGKSVGSRWGRIVFDDNGVAKHEIPDADLATVAQLGWDKDPVAERAAAIEAIKARDAQVKAASNTVTFTVVSQAHAGKSVGTRWGRVSFDTSGLATLSAPLDDAALLEAVGFQIVSHDGKKAEVKAEAPPAGDDTKTGDDTKVGKVKITKSKGD